VSKKAQDLLKEWGALIGWFPVPWARSLKTFSKNGGR